ncbi:hypothetical protein HBE96_23290 [Clostridium sp. P21]|uniref:Uncharacterized protein n=1 Tax=Clostridium muellerianum TaxID=2716538 RepID=A0A7Y0HRS2_9CLOT|nr:hypothetical protein [Clostridium muellerianum]NMM65506.1 hypothetical protein [Clostridium muellerianum]
MVNQIIVKIIAERIINKGLNPLRNRVFLLEDVTNVDYKKAVEDYIIINSGAVTQ